MNIKIYNFKNGETVTYPIIKILGGIETDRINLVEEVCTIINEDTIYAKLVENKFKFVLQLTEGTNKFTFIYENIEIELDIIYEKKLLDYSVLPLYIVCKGHNGKFQAPENEDNTVESACKRIYLASQLLQCITAEKINEHVYERRTFCLEENCMVFRSCLNYSDARKMKAEELWEYFGREIMNSSFYNEKQKYLAFLSCTWYNGKKYNKHLKGHDDLVALTEGYVALGGGGLALFGTACLYTWPERFEEVIKRFEDHTLVDKRKFLDDSCYRGTYGSCFSTTLGSVLHELCHTFDLGHTENGIMGRGFDNISKVFTFHSPENKNNKPFLIREKELVDPYDDTYLTKSCAVLLAYHRWFKPSKNSNGWSISCLESNPKFIKSNKGIRVIEIRDAQNEMVMNEWTFPGIVLTYFFEIPMEILNNEKLSDAILFVQDTEGNIIKQKLKN